MTDQPKDLTPHRLGEAIRMCRKEKNLTLKQVAVRTELSVSYLSDIERDRTLPTLETLSKIAKALDHMLTIGMREAGEFSFPCTPDEAELLYALRGRDFARFALMAGAILNADHIDGMKAEVK